MRKEAERLMAETRLWRLANSAQWTAWGIVQANIPGLPAFDKEGEGQEEGKGQNVEGNKEKQAAQDKEVDAEHRDGEGVHDKSPPPEDEEFDYLSYAQERAMFVWGDAVQLGIVKLEELPKDVRSRLKVVEY